MKKLKVGDAEATVVRRGTIVSVYTASKVWMLNTPDAADVVEELENGKVTATQLEARGFTAMKS